MSEQKTPLPEIPDGYMMDSKGRMVPEHLVKQSDLLMDQTVRKMLEFAEDLNKQIARFKGHCFDDIYTATDLLAESYGVKRGGAKGNVTLITFDGCAKVEVKVQDHIDFGPELQAAKQLVDECIGDWSEGSREEIRALVNHAFDVEKTGRVNREALFRLRRLDIDDPRWKKAVEAINDSIRVIGSKAYIRFATRPTPRDRWRYVPIDLAAV
ncbi:MAG: DUF3164 family protein [Alphaproteobacteria bacterium]